MRDRFSADCRNKMTYWLLQVFNGISFGMLLFLLASGLSLIYGLMRIFNLSHGSFYLIGGYVGLSVVKWSGSFLLAVLSAGIVMSVLGLAIERYLLRRVHNNDLGQVLITFGLLFILADFAMMIWGGHPQNIPRPEALSQPINIGTVVVPSYRVALVVIGVLTGAILWLLIERTRFGTMIRASVDDPEMAQAISVRVSFVQLAVFGLGAALAGMAGVVGGVLFGLYPSADFEVLLLAFIVVIIGGVGSIAGAFVGSLFVGLVDTFGKALFPELAMFTLFVPMVAMLAFRPTGFFGEKI